jgi:DNA sulfur modification protein DndB
MWDKVINFWDFFFEIFPEAMNFIMGNKDINDNSFNRNKENGGSLLLRPEGQLLFTEIYSLFENDNIDDFKKKVSKIDFNLSNSIWNYVFWDNGIMVSKNKKLKTTIFRHLLGKTTDSEKSYLNTEMTKIYAKYGQKYQYTIQPVLD